MADKVFDVCPSLFPFPLAFCGAEIVFRFFIIVSEVRRDERPISWLPGIILELLFPWFVLFPVPGLEGKFSQ